MTRNLKALGLALVAAFAMSAIIASAASAEVLFHVEKPNTTLTIHHTTESPQVFEVEGIGTVTCPSVGIDTTVEPETTSEITSVPTYPATESETEKCKITTPAGTFKAHIDLNSCDYLFTSNEPGTELEPEHHKYKGSVHIRCKTEGDSITVTATILGQSVACIHIPAQTPTEPYVDYTNTGTGNERDVLLTSTVKGITYTLTPACNKGTEVEANNAKYTGEATIIGEDSLGNRRGVWVT